MRLIYQKLRDAAEGQSCVRCGADDATTVLAHYTGPRRDAYKGGMGHKGHDVVGAHLCGRCHHYFDTGAKTKDDMMRWMLSEEFLHYIALTLMRLLTLGVLK